MKKWIHIVLLLITTSVLAQQPTHATGPQNNTPINLNSWFDIVVFIVLPLAMVFFYFQWRRQVKKEKEEAKKKEKSS